MPRLIQPTLAWISLFNKIAFYHHVIRGAFIRDDRDDLGKEDAWISYTMLAGGLAIDIADKLEGQKTEALGQWLRGQGLSDRDLPPNYLQALDRSTDILKYDDHFMLFADYQSYIDCQDRVSEAFRDELNWSRYQHFLQILLSIYNQAFVPIDHYASLYRF